MSDQAGDSSLGEIGQELFIQEEDIDKLETFLAERDGHVDVVLADPRSHEDGEGGDKGDLESKIFEFFQEGRRLRSVQRVIHG